MTNLNNYKVKDEENTYYTLVLPTRTQLLLKNKYGKKVWKIEIVNCLTNDSNWKTKVGNAWVRDLKVVASIGGTVKFLDISLKTDHTTKELYFEVFYNSVIYKIDSIDGHDPMFFAPHLEHIVKD